MKKILSLVFMLLLFTGCSGGEATREDITVGGSTSVLALMEKLGVEYEAVEDYNINIQGGGSGVGIKGTNEGTFEIGMISRDLKEEEKEGLTTTVIAIDGIAIIVNKDNGVSDLTSEQVKDIFTGKVTNWNQLGGADGEIAVISREDGSGTRSAFEEIIGYESSALVGNAEIQKATNAVISSVEGNPNAIGFISLGSMKDNVKSLQIGGVDATDTNIQNGSYTISRNLSVITKDDSEKVTKFIDYILSEEGQKIVADNNYISVK